MTNYAKNTTTVANVMALGFVLATLLTMLLATTCVKSVKAGFEHSLAFKTDGTVWARGRNNNGQLGIGTSGNISNVPVAVKNLTNVRNMDGGDRFTLATAE